MRETETQAQSPHVYMFCWMPLTGQTQREDGRQRSSADALQRHQTPGECISWD